MKNYFNRSEFKCKCGKCDHVAVDYELLNVLNEFREWIKKPVIITSGNRCPEYNKAIGGAKNSKHMYSIAADIQVKGVNPTEIYEYFNMRYPDKYGLGLYSSWVHIDVREEKARW